MSKKQKKRATIQPLRTVRSIREMGPKTYSSGRENVEINDGEEFQARDGSNLRTMAEAEAEELADQAQAQPEPTATQSATPNAEPDSDRTIPQLVWSLVSSPYHLAVALLRNQTT